MGSHVRVGCPTHGLADDGDECTAESCAGDCNDDDASISPDSPELCGDDTDNDCDGNIDEGGDTTWYADGDSDGYAADGSATVTMCSEPASAPEECSEGSWTATEPSDNSVDCHDQNDDVHPDQSECFDNPDSVVGFDYDCDGTETECLTQSAQCVTGPSGCAPNRNGWTSGVPHCGQAGTFIDEPEDCQLVGSGPNRACQVNTGDTRPQTCR